MKAPVWVVLEGGDGAGKGVAGGTVRQMLEDRSMKYIRTREPGGTEQAEVLRSMLLGMSGEVWEKNSEILLMTTSRIEHVTKVIRPHLALGTSVVCDRYVHSTVAYQGHGHQGSVDFILRLHQDAVGGDMPDLAIILDVDPAIGLERARARLADSAVDEGRMESLSLEFHQRVREGYLSMARNDPVRHMVVDASLTVPEVKAEIERRFGRWLDERDGWTSWHGRYSSVLNAPDIGQATPVMVKRRDGRIDGPYPCGRIEWHHQNTASDIMFYRIIEER